MNTQKGSVSINTENIFPIIKKWLYSEKDIFIREIVSNASDAISKLKKLAAVGEWEAPEDQEWKIEVTLDKESGTITVYDNGIGMTEEEVIKYINQIAFSGAKDFIEKYQGKTDDAQIIGHFGLGFYSAFMVSDKVEIDTKSYIDGSESVHWESNTGMDFEISPSEIENRGTYITMHLAEDSKEYLDAFTLKETLEKYFSFLPINLYFIDTEKDIKETEEENVVEVNEDGTPEEKKEPEKKPLNDTTPLWQKAPKDCTEEEYKAFYHKVFNDYNDPLFWIHLNMDYPFNLKGILYFPKLRKDYDTLEGTIKVYYNQVFVADNIKEVLPEFLLLLKGTIDCPDLPLNVSRSFLQNDGYVSKISAHITKKVADKLNGLLNTERENYCKYWDDINPFVKFGCLKDEKFYDKVKDAILFKTTDDQYQLLSEMTGDDKDKEVTIYYADDTVVQAQYIHMFDGSDKKVYIMDGPIDNHFINFFEYKNTGKVKFVRIDSDVSDTMKDENAAFNQEDMDKLAGELEGSFRTLSGNDKLKVAVQALKTPMPGIITLSEQGRRMQEMYKMYGGMGLDMAAFGQDEITLVLNQNSPLIDKIARMKDNEAEAEDYNMICSHIYDLARLAHQPLDAKGMTDFIERSALIMNKII